MAWCTPFAVILIVANSTPFGMPPTAFWMYVFALAVCAVGLLRVVKDTRPESGLDKIMPLGELFFAIPMSVFGTEHFTATADIASIVPRWIPGHLFWVYLIGLGFICAGFSIALRVQARLAAALVGITFIIFVSVMMVPGVIAEPHNRFAWILAFRESTFSCGALAFAFFRQPRQPPSRLSPASWGHLPRIVVGMASVFYGVEHLLHPEHVPGIPLERITPAWLPGRIALTYFVGIVLIAAGFCLLTNKKARLAATILGLTILLTMLWVYLPMLIAAPKEVETLNYFFDTLLFCGAILLLANSLQRDRAFDRVAVNHRTSVAR